MVAHAYRETPLVSAHEQHVCEGVCEKEAEDGHLRLISQCER